jgi:hypothetical protein
MGAVGTLRIITGKCEKVYPNTLDDNSSRATG